MIAEPQMPDVAALAAQEYPTIETPTPKCQLNGQGCMPLEVRAEFQLPPECFMTAETDITIESHNEVIAFNDKVLTLSNPLKRPEPPVYPDLRKVSLQICCSSVQQHASKPPRIALHRFTTFPWCSAHTRTRSAPLHALPSR